MLIRPIDIIFLLNSRGWLIFLSILTMPEWLAGNRYFRALSVNFMRHHWHLHAILQYMAQPMNLFQSWNISLYYRPRSSNPCFCSLENKAHYTSSHWHVWPQPYIMVHASVVTIAGCEEIEVTHAVNTTRAIEQNKFVKVRIFEWRHDEFGSFFFLQKILTNPILPRMKLIHVTDRCFLQ